MIEINNIEPVWDIENNELKKSNKIVSKIIYQNTEIPVLKTERDSCCQDYLFKDINNEYWSMRIASIDFDKFIKVALDDTLKDSKEYCNKVLNFVAELDLKEYFDKKIDKEMYFNKCELKYISKYYPNIYENAMKCRNTVIEKNKKENEEQEQQRKQEEREKVEKVNGKFEKRLEEIKNAIRIGKNVESEDFEYYKDNKYENCITVQNCFLYLAKQYGINIPLATQGFINKRLVSYDFTTGTFSFKVTSNKKPSEKIHQYLYEIKNKVKEEFDHSVKDLKSKVENMKAR